MGKTNAADLSRGVFAILVCVTPYSDDKKYKIQIHCPSTNFLKTWQ